MNGITRRWLRGSLLITVLVIVVAEGLFLYAGHSSYYGSARQTMLNRFSSITGQLKMYTDASSDDPAGARSQALRRMVEQFDDKDKFEFQLLDASGGVLSSSTGFAAGGAAAAGDFAAAFESPDGVGSAVYTTPENERVMAVTRLVPYAAGEVAAMRMVTSLALIDELLSRQRVMSLGVALVVLSLTIWSGLFFVRSIVKPLGRIEATATAIARGDLDVRLPEPARKDEIGRLCGTINQMARDLAKTERMKNEFISSVSHELRTPLTSIKGWVETIAQIRDPEDKNYRKGLAIIGAETDRLYAMVEELLDFSRLQSGIRMECSALDLVAELTDAALFVEGRIRQEGLRLVYEEPELPLPVWADAGRLRQVFVNLLDNAIKYSNPGGAITLDLLQDGENAYVLVQDEGRGIEPDDLENVKLKFFKGKGAVRGSGIGLAVVDEIVAALDGSVDIASTPGKGTTVTVRLPLYTPGLPRGLPAG